MSPPKRRTGVKAAYATLGCKVSQYETQAMRTAMEERGFETVPFSSAADVYVINSCTVTSTGDKKSRQMVHRARRTNPDAAVVLCGCFPQASPEKAEEEKCADIICGTADRLKLPDMVEKFLSERERIVRVKKDIRHEAYEPMRVDRLDEHTRAYIKIEDGCDRFCSYCLVPFARGNVRSRPIDDIKREAAELFKNGYLEAVLIGINLSAYSWDGHDLADAVQAAADSGIPRIRLGSLEPDLLTEKMLSQLAGIPGFCRQFHISLQSGSDSVLRRMNRKYSSEEYAALTEKIRVLMPDAAITTDIMVGFPGETEEEFRETAAFAEKIGFASAHIFVYSPRPGTAAASMAGRVPPEIGKRRSRKLSETVEKSAERRRKWLVGRFATVLALDFDGENTLCIAGDGTETLVKGKQNGILYVKYTEEKGGNMVAERTE